MEEQKPNEQNSFNPFASSETPSNSYAGQTPNPAESGSGRTTGHSNPSDFTGQTQFPRFNNAKLDPSGIGADAADIRKRMEDAKSNGWGAQLVGFFSAHKAHIAIVLAVVALFAAGSYAARFSGPNERTESSTAALSSQAIQDNDDAAVFDIKLDKTGVVILENAGGGSEFLADAQDGSSITKTAMPGEGITHLARKALLDYLAQEGKSLSAEQKIYAEDYVQNMTGDEWLDVGQKLSFSRGLLQDATQAAEGLQDWQIENLKQYTATVSLL